LFALAPRDYRARDKRGLSFPEKHADKREADSSIGAVRLNIGKTPTIGNICQAAALISFMRACSIVESAGPATVSSDRSANE